MTIERKYTHNAIIYNYFNAEGDEREIYNEGKNVFYEGDVLYSYGRHFPLCVKTISGGYVINADTYSSSSSKHTRMTIYHAPDDTPQIPFSALRGAGINPKDIQVIEKTEDTWRFYENGKIVEKPFLPRVGCSFSYRVPRWVDLGKKFGLNRLVHHVLGACLFKTPQGVFLSSIDGGNYYLVQLRRKVWIVEEAYREISGLDEYKWESYLKGDILRQGEFFFHPVGHPYKDIVNYLRWNQIKFVEIKHYDIQKFFNPISNGNSHTVTHAIVVIGENGFLGFPQTRPVLYVRGTVRHPQHGMLKLGDGKEPFYVTINNVAGSWTATGSVD